MVRTMTVEAGVVAEALKRYFGFDAFRPLQEAIVGDVLDGRDVFALLPTGGGKSLCYQLPALLSAGHHGRDLAADRADEGSGRRADHGRHPGDVSSTRRSTTTKCARRIDGLRRGAYRLLYVAPERLTIPAFAAELATLNVTRFAVDEAHCISEWGHDFRPDYRRIAELRERFPDVPFLAFTATATDRVRADIVERARRCTIRPSTSAASTGPTSIYRVTRKKRSAGSADRLAARAPR